MAKVTHEFDLYGKHYVLETGELQRLAAAQLVGRVDQRSGEGVEPGDGGGLLGGGGLL